MTSVFLIPYELAVQITNIPDHINGDAYSVALNTGEVIEGSPAWATAETLEGLKVLGITPEVLEERPLLPVFHSLGRYIETQSYEEILSCIGYAKYGEDVGGIAYIGFGCEKDVWQMHDPALGDCFFYFTLNESRAYIWFAVTSTEGAQFLYNVMYHRDENMLAWLRSVGFDPLQAEEEGSE